MDFQPKSCKKIRQLIDKGVDIPNPGTLDIGEDVNIDRISQEGVTIYPGCRIYGGKTVISSGCQLGYEAPATIEDCQLGSKVALKGGFFSKSVFLEKASMGMGAHVREGCILEEEASGAHCVGLKQTILFPFVTLGSLINFCDCLMAGGTSRSNHSEVGSSYIHFNYTPDADKTTPSLLGDVPRGVMLNQPPIFLGGQGGMVGPLRLGYGNVAAAGSILRHDYPQDNQLIVDTPPSSGVRDFVPAAYPHLHHLLENNIFYLANLRALEAWYKNVRKTFFETQEFGTFLYDGAMDVLSLARNERLKRLRIMAEKTASPSLNLKPESSAIRQAFHEHIEKIEIVLNETMQDDARERDREAFLGSLAQSGCNGRKPYIETIQNLSPDLSAKGEKWLQGIVDYYCQRIATVISSIPLFRTS
ncbi:MAG: UDP-N-acetylglucosamine pyrophosphorylase [Deltaproteobacteria bacterium HGW-Deltaproteobacteria-6]|jgi:UDP-N-acetylglucosamine/UDP-N-acetylgalactosamine diphosphorylase|nr:MAG: UDP-N-acetylglucosamine pyrophosphorylase [Deltaproteobacteria bacterium HGW-Deltaproteobacteria-6]